jgi:hypothetical protein
MKLSLLIFGVLFLSASCKHDTDKVAVPVKDSVIIPKDSIKIAKTYYYGSTHYKAYLIDTFYNDTIRVELQYHTLLHDKGDSLLRIEDACLEGSPFSGSFSLDTSNTYDSDTEPARHVHTLQHFQFIGNFLTATYEEQHASNGYYHNKSYTFFGKY